MRYPVQFYEDHREEVGVVNVAFLIAIRVAFSGEREQFGTVPRLI